MSEIIVIGSINIDLVCYSDRMPLPGETIIGKNFIISNGGKGANQAVMASKLGSKVTIVGRIGDDHFGELYKKDFEKFNIDTTFLKKTNNITTGTATIIVESKLGQNSIIIVPGANGLMNENDIDFKIDNIIKLSKLIIVQLEINHLVSLKALKLAKQYNVITIFNYAPAIKLISNEFFQNTDILCCNETESEILTGDSLDFNNQESIFNIMKKLLNLGCQVIILTLGSYGAKMIIKSKPNIIYSSLCPINKEPIVDTTGAGDAFIGAFSHILIQKLNKGQSLLQVLNQKILDDSVKIASLTVLKKGAQSSYPLLSELTFDISD